MLHENHLQPVPAPRVSPPRLDLAEILDPKLLAAISEAKKIVFHAVGDTGAAKVNAFQTAQQAIANEAAVADAMAADVAAGGPNPPAFFFHLGDVVYNFGEGQYYYDQFYEPFRAYDRPIFAIPGNHDGMVFGDTNDTPQVPTLTAFLRNFCADTPAQSPDASTIVRSTMTQPGVYFTLGSTTEPTPKPTTASPSPSPQEQSPEATASRKRQRRRRRTRPARARARGLGSRSSQS